MILLARVVQPNLIFVVGLPTWISKDKEILKGQNYFGRYGKIFKVEVNQNQTFGGPQVCLMNDGDCVQTCVLRVFCKLLISPLSLSNFSGST